MSPEAPGAPKAVPVKMGLAENDVQSTIGSGGKRVWIYAREVAGHFTQRRTAVAWVLLLLYLGVPWVHWNGLPLVQLDIFSRRLLVLGHSYYPQDLKLFLPGFLAFIVVVFLVTATWGRIWCGWACPQTVFLQFIFGPIEKWVEGRASVRKARDAAGFSWDWVWRKIVKEVLFLLVAFGISNTALAYLWGRDNVLWALTHPPSDNPTGFAFMLAFALVFYWVFAYFREQACVLICPYARFQSVLLDESSLTVAYDTRRGEPRGRGQKGRREGLGDCVNCGHCVAVCPTGIDIRKGQQLECIGCTRCIDACDSIMTAWKKPQGLIRYTSLAGLDGESRPGIRPRQIAYGALAAVLGAFSLILIVTRPVVAVDVARRGFNPYTHVGADSILNTFTVQVRNKDVMRHTFSLDFDESAPARQNWQDRRFAVGAGQLQTLPLDIVIRRDAFRQGERVLHLILRGDGGIDRKFDATLIGPFGAGDTP